MKIILISIYSIDMKEQREYLDKHFEEWKGEYDQVDDDTTTAYSLLSKST